MYYSVGYMSGVSSSSCGYCHSGKDSSKTVGIWMYQLTVEQYQLMLNFGWRRSGKYLYKPIMTETCCPAYTIRLDAKKFALSKGQSKVLRKMRKYLREGGDVSLCKRPNTGSEADVATDLVQPNTSVPVIEDASMNESMQQNILAPKKRNDELKRDKGIEALIDSIENIDGVEHSMQVKLEKAKCDDTTFNLYKKYQMFIHNDPESKITVDSFTGFLVDSPLIQKDAQYGTFHQKYYIDDKLIAVAVLDVLPLCVSSVYFFYDPDYGRLGLGNYSALREIALTLKLGQTYPAIQYYYMGYYISSCEKMKYKGSYRPSDLLCPANYKWVPLALVKEILETEKATALTDESLQVIQAPKPLDSIPSHQVTLEQLSLIKILKNQSIVSISAYANKSDFVNHFKVLIKECGTDILENMAFVSP